MPRWKYMCSCLKIKALSTSYWQSWAPKKAPQWLEIILSPVTGKRIITSLREAGGLTRPSAECASLIEGRGNNFVLCFFFYSTEHVCWVEDKAASGAECIKPWVFANIRFLCPSSRTYKRRTLKCIKMSPPFCRQTAEALRYCIRLRFPSGSQIKHFLTMLKDIQDSSRRKELSL